MRHMSTLFGLVVMTTVVLDFLWSWLQRNRPRWFAVWSALLASTVWVVTAGVLRNQHAADFPAKYPKWFNFLLPSAAALPAAVVGVLIALLVRALITRYRDGTHSSSQDGSTPLPGCA